MDAERHEAKSELDNRAPGKRLLEGIRQLTKTMSSQQTVLSDRELKRIYSAAMELVVAVNRRRRNKLEVAAAKL